MDYNDELSTPQVINEFYPGKANKGLWNPARFVVLSIFFSFLPAGILYSLNYGRVGSFKKRNTSLLVICAVFAIAIMITFTIEKDIAKSLFLGLNVGVGIYMQREQKKLFKDHIANGGRKASYIFPVIFCIIFVALLIWAMIYSQNIPDKSIVINGDEIYYTDNIKKDEADKLGEYLKKEGLFVQDNKTISIKIDNKENAYIVSIIVNKESVESPDTSEYAKFLGKTLSTEVFSNSKVQIILCDDRFNSLKTINIE